MKILFLFLGFLFTRLSFCQEAGFKLFLIGDTGEDTIVQPALRNFLDTISKYPNSAAVFLGDNCYHDGGFFGLGKLKGFDSTELTIKRLGMQLQGLVTSNYHGNVYFIPGNHDWWNNSNMKKGKRHLKMEQSFIESKLHGNKFIKNDTSIFMPKNGCPIDAVDLNDNKLKLIFLDTQWLIIQKHKNERDTVYLKLDSIIDEAILNKQKVVVTGHHPIYTIGKHSKKIWLPFKQAKNQNIYYRKQQEMRDSIKAIFHRNTNDTIIYASGHDHILEHFREDNVRYIVSGAGSKSSMFNKKHVFNPNPGSDIPVDRICKSMEGFFEVDCSGKNFIIKMLSLEVVISEEIK